MRKRTHQKRVQKPMTKDNKTPSDRTTKPHTIRFDRELAERLTGLAADKNMGFANVVREACELGEQRREATRVLPNDRAVLPGRER